MRLCCRRRSTTAACYYIVVAFHEEHRDALTEKFNDYSIIKYNPSPDVIRHVDEVLTLLRVMTGDSRYEQMLNEEKGVKPKNMCEVLDYRENKGRIEGRKEGRKEGIKEGKTEGMFLGELKEKQKVALQLVKKGFEPELILEILEINEEELEQLLSGEEINVND